MRSAPSARGWSRNALNLISALHSTSGLGVRPARYSARNVANTRSRYSAAKFTASMSIASFSATATASMRSSRVEQCSASSSSSQFFMKSPMTSCPARFRSSAATAESTPPERPTTTFIPCLRCAVKGSNRDCERSNSYFTGSEKQKAGPRPRPACDTGAVLLLRRVLLLVFLGVGLGGVGGLRRFGLLGGGLLDRLLLGGFLLLVLLGLVLHGRLRLHRRRRGLGRGYRGLRGLGG